MHLRILTREDIQRLIALREALDKKIEALEKAIFEEENSNDNN